MTKRRKGFEIEISDVSDVPLGQVPKKALRRGPMAAAISENANSLKERQVAEAQIRAENDALAQEFVRLKSEGLVIDRLPLSSVVTERILRDRREGSQDDLDELVQSIREVGLSNPIRVEARSDGKFELIQGMRRLLAYRMLDSNGETGFDTIPAGISPVLETETAYRQMVDENLVRKDISFAEMAVLAQRYADDPAHDCAEVSDAVAVLFKSASYTKRSYIRAFAELIRTMDGNLRFAHDIPRNLGVDVKRKLDNDPEALTQLRAALRAEPLRDSAGEVAILRAFLGEVPQTLPTGKVASGKPRRAKTTFQVSLPQGVAKCSASQGRIEFRDDRDFSAIDRQQLERAVAAFYAALEAE